MPHGDISGPVRQETMDISVEFTSGLLYALARESAARASFDTLAAILLAASAFEAFLGELSQLAQTLEAERADVRRSAHYPVELPDLAAFAAAILQVTNARRSPRARFDLAYEMLAGGPVDKNIEPRTSLDLLFDLRNDITHIKPGRTRIVNRIDPNDEANFEGYWLGHITSEYDGGPEYLAKLEARNLLLGGNDSSIRWTDRICTAALGSWCCDTARRSAEALVSVAPVGSRLREDLGRYSLCASRK